MLTASSLATVGNLDGPGRYLHWSIFTVSEANLALIAVMVVIFGAALMIPFPGRHHDHESAPAPGSAEEAVATACRVRLRPVLMTSLATILGMIPMALALEAGSEQYAPLARAIIGGLTMSVIVTVFIVPAAYLLIHRREEQPAPAVQG